MFWGLAAGRVDGRGFEFEHVLEGIQTLNEWALEGRLEVTAISLHTYPFVQDKYVILPHGASMGSGYGPVVVAKRPMTREELKEVEIAVPGRMTTAFLVAALLPGRRVPLPRGAVRRDHGRGRERRRRGRAPHPRGPAHLRQHGLERIVDLGEWWLLETGLPLPLGINIARRDLGAETLRTLSDVLRDSIGRASSTARRRSSTPSSSAAGSTPELADSSSACT